jgi:hypothetical protein
MNDFLLCVEFIRSRMIACLIGIILEVSLTAVKTKEIDKIFRIIV